MNAKLAAAETDQDVMVLLKEAKAYANSQRKDLDKGLDEIIDEAARIPGLKERVKEARAYADKIKEEQGRALADAVAGADLAAQGAKAGIAIANVRSSLMRGLATAKDQAQVDELLESAET